MIKDIINNDTKSSQEKVMEIYEILQKNTFTELSESEKVFVCIGNLEIEVNNGGFSQFFFNESGNYAEETLQALEIIGAQKTAHLLRKAIAEFPNSKVPQGIDSRQEIMEEIEVKAEDAWEELDESFYAYEDDLAELLLVYVKNHQEDFKH